MRRFNLKRMLCGLVVMSMAACMFVGCGNDAVSEKPESSQEIEESVESAYPSYLNMDGYKPMVKDGEEVTLSVAVKRDSGANTPIEDMWIFKYIEDKLNINLEVKSYTDENVAEQKSLMLASGEIPDITISLGFTKADEVQYGVDEELFLPISDYFSEELTPNILNALNDNPSIAENYTAPNGKMYTVPQINAVYPGKPGTTGSERFFIDTRYMDAIGMKEAPKTLDELVDMLRAFKKLDPATMGVDEIYPVIGESSGSLVRGYLYTALGWVGNGVAEPIWDEAEQKIVVPCNEEKFGEYIKLMNTLYTEGLLHPDYYTMDDMEARALMAEGKAAVIADAAPYICGTQDWDYYIQANPVTSAWNDTPISVAEATIEDSGIFISADTEYPELCVRLLDYIYSPEGSIYFERGPMAGTEDTLGVVTGFSLTEDKSTLAFEDVNTGKYESLYSYLINEVRLGNHYNCNMNYVELDALEWLGVENPQFKSMDLSNPDDNYRDAIYQAQHEYLVDPLPKAYLTVEQGNDYTDMRTVIEDYVNAETAKFVVGQRSLEEIDDFFEELKTLKIDEYVELCQEIYANYTR